MLLFVVFVFGDLFYKNLCFVFSIATSSYSKVAYTCLVGEKKTTAQCKVESPAEIVKFLKALVQTQKSLA